MIAMERSAAEAYAVTTYGARWAALDEERREALHDERYIKAAKLEQAIARLKRAALDEEIDLRPQGLPE